MNLLYVAMTRAKQVLLVSGNGEAAENSWHTRITQVCAQTDNPLLGEPISMAAVQETLTVKIDTALSRPIPTGKYVSRGTVEQRHGTWLHALLQYMVPPNALIEKAVLQERCGIPADEIDEIWQKALYLIKLPELARFFEPERYRNASNELSYVNEAGELKRIDRLVEFEDAVWILDYKTGAGSEAHVAQLAEYRSAMQAVYSGKPVHCALIFEDGRLQECGQ